MFKKPQRRTASRRNFSSVPLNGFSNSLDGNGLTYPTRVTFYPSPPMSTLTLEQFETYAIDRLKLLIEMTNLQGQGLSYDEVSKMMKDRLKILMPLHALGTQDVSIIQSEREKDYISHFILRLAFCKSDELRRKFIMSEVSLFKMRFQDLNKQERLDFLKTIDLPWQDVSQEERDSLKDGLITVHYGDVTYGIKQGQFQVDMNKYQHKTLNSEDIWEILQNNKIGKLPWQFVPDLVANRKVLIHKGFAYVPEFLQLNLISQEFSNQLNEQLLLTNKYLIGMDEDDRLIPILESLSQGYINSETQSNQGSEVDGEINASNVKDFVKYFPACGHRLYQTLESQNHLKYQGRSQFQLFLKGIGLGPNEAVKFWQMMFTKGGSISADKFNKEYKYNIRHAYGLEGARINYSPWNCAQILSKPKPNSSEAHGCPYRDLSQEKLQNLLANMGMEDDGTMQSVVGMAQQGNYQAACSKVFETLNAENIQKNQQLGLPVQETGIQHPNDYFNRAVLYEKRLQKDLEV